MTLSQKIKKKRIRSFDYICDKCYGAKIPESLSKLAFHFTGSGFVDNTYIIQTGDTNEDQEDIGLWETGARVSCGALVPDKSWYSLIDFECDDGDWTYKTEMKMWILW